MAVPYCHAAARGAATSLRSATSRPSAPRSKPTPNESFPKAARILRTAEYRKVYDTGWRYTCPLFTAFCLRTGADSPARFGFTLPSAIGKATVRNRIKRRMREAVRRLRPQFPAGLAIVVNPRKAAFDAPAESIRREFERLAARCGR
jgi:ribonuclease P protein component